MRVSDSGFLHIRCRHAADLAVFEDLLRLWKGGCHPFQNSLVIDVHLHIHTGKVDALEDIGRQFTL